MFGYAGGQIARKLGFDDINTAMASGRLNSQQVAGEIQKIPLKSIPKSIIGGALTEGLLEELPQSVSEQILQNMALNKPLDEGVDSAIVMGTLAGMAMGGGMNTFSAPMNYVQNNRAYNEQQARIAQEQQAEADRIAAAEQQQIAEQQRKLFGFGTNPNATLNVDDIYAKTGIPPNPVIDESKLLPNALSYQNGIDYQPPQINSEQTSSATPINTNGVPYTPQRPSDFWSLAGDVQQDYGNSIEFESPESKSRNLESQIQFNDTYGQDMPDPVIDYGALSPFNDAQQPIIDQTKLSERLGINPNDGPMSSAAALAVDSGASPIAQLGYTPEQQSQEQSNTPISDAVPSNYQSLLGSQNGGQPFNANLEDATAQQGNTQADNAGKSISQQYDTNAADAMGGGIETDRAKTTTAQTVQPILGQDGKNKWFGTQEKAQAFIDKKDLGNDYQVVQDGKRFEIQPKQVAQNDNLNNQNTTPDIENNIEKSQEIADLEQQFANEKSVPKKAQIRKQITELQNSLTEQSQSTVSLNQPENTVSEDTFESENPNGKAPSPTEQKIRETLQRNDTQQNGKKMESAATILANQIKKDGPEYFTLGWNKDAQLTAEAHDYVETILDEALSNLGIKGFDDADSFSKLTNDVLESIDDVYATADDSDLDNRPVKDKDGNYNAPKLVKVKDEKGRTRYVLEHELNNPNVEYLRNFTESGRRSAVKISRENIFQDTPQNKQDASREIEKQQQIKPKSQPSDFIEVINVGGKKAPTAEQVVQKAIEPKAEPEQPKAKAEPSKNTLVSDDRAAELRARLKAKLSQLNSGIDPEIMAIGAELAVYHIERGARKFAAFAKNIAADLDVSVEKIRPYLRSWYNGARDMMEDMGADIQGMDNAETVRAELEKLDNPQQFEAKLYASLGLELPENQEDTANEQPTSNTSNSQGASAVRGGRGRTPQSNVALGNNRNVDEGVSTGSGTSNQNQSTGRSRIRDTGTDVENDGRVYGRGMESSRREDASGTGQLRVDQPTRLKSPAAVANTATDFYMADPELIIGGTQVKRFDKNKASLELLEELTNEGRQATTEEQAILAGYTGWGSFGQDLFQGTWDKPVFKDESVWKERNLWLRERLGKESWESAKDSTINAHFTDPYTVAAMWSMAEKMGFTGGRVLEPAIGTGNFISLMPKHIKQRSQVTGIDLDITTAAIAKQLFPESNVQNMPYQKSQTPDNFYDLVISNVPFADIKIADRRYNQFNPNLHDYYFLKMLDQVRPGGIVMAITSSGTMDKQSEVIRRELAKKAELITSVRLPSGAFQEYAGTAVVTDIIVLRKRAEPLTMTPEVNWIGLSEVKTSSKPVKVNSFYAENLSNVLGDIDYGSGTTRFGAGMIVHRPHDLKQRLEKAANFVPEDALLPRHNKDHLTYYANKAGERTNTLTISDGELMFVYGDQMVKATDLSEYKLKDAKKTAQRQKSIEDLIAIRKAYTDLTDAERIEQDNVEQLRKTLNKLYQAYTKEHGPLADSFGLQYFHKLGDAYYYSLAALEVNGKPAEILKRSVVRGADTLKNPTVSDAFVVERNKTAIPSLSNIAKLANVSEDQARAELIAKGAIYVLPNGDIMPSDMYLSGNVRLKLEEAQNAVAEGNTDLQRNLDALKEIIPEDIPYFNIEAKMGATWVPLSDYEKYIAHMLGMTDTTGITVTFPNGKWKVKLDPIAARRTEAKTNYGTVYKSFQTVASAALSNQTITVKYKNEDGSESVDIEATEEVNERISKIKEDFATWLWSDPERRVQLEKEYNHTFNAWATPKYDGSFMSMQGMALSLGNGPFNLRQHQQNAIWRAIVNRKSINAHEVGTGKTFTMGGIAIESRRYGIAKKPLILAHNANSAAVAKEIQMMYPSARVLFISELGKAIRQIRMRQIANDDWDVVVMPHSMIDKLTLSEETLMAMAADDIAALEAEIEEALAEEGGATLDEVLEMDSETVNKKMGFKNPTAKQLAKQRLKLLEDIQKQAMDSSKADAVNFEELGVDMIMVDEVHEFKKPSIATRMNMKGLNTSSNKRSVNLQFLTRYVRRMNNGGNVHTFTGTPITNTLTEIYHQMRYVMEEEMQKLNVAAWDGWFGSFATDITDIELSATGEYQLVTRLAGFVNVPELRKMIGQFMDIVFANDMPEMQPRKTKSGKILSDESLTEAEKAELLNGRTEDAKDRPYKKVINVTTEMSPKQEQALAEIQSLAKEWERASGKQKRQWMRDGDPRSPLSISTAAKKASYDARIGDPEYIGQEGKTEDFEMSKASQVVKNVMEVYHSHPLASQVIFADTGYNTTTERSTGQKDANGKTIRERVKVFSPIKDIVERLVQSGIPREQIAIVDGSVKAEARKAIADKMNTGEIRVVIGLTQTLGVGVNMQRNLRAMHHLDAPWMPGELEQRNGRGLRQGNQWNTVLEYRYITDKLDGKSWQVLAIKDRFINSFMKADGNVRSIEGDAAADNGEDNAGDIMSSFSEASGDPRVLQRIKMKEKLEKLQRKERLHTQGIADMKRTIGNTQRRIARIDEQIAEYENNAVLDRIQTLMQSQSENFSVEVDGKKYDKHKEASDAIQQFIVDHVRTGSSRITLGKYSNVTMSVEWDSLQPQATLSMKIGPIEFKGNTLRGIEGKLRGAAQDVKALEDAKVSAQDTINNLSKAAEQPFGQADQLARTQKQLENIEQDLENNPVAPPIWLRRGAPIDSEVYYKGKLFIVSGHRYTNDGWFVSAEDAKGTIEIPYLEATDSVGMQIYEEREFEAPNIEDKTKNEEVKQPKETGSQQDPLYSRKSGNQKTGKTIAQVREALIKRFGKATIEELEKQGKLEIIQDYQVEGVEGYYRNGKAVLVASNLNDDTIIPTFLHELGGHAGFQNMMKPEQYADLMQQFERMVKQGNPIALEAKKLAEREQGSERQQLEYLPYLLTLASTMQQKNVLQRNALQKLIRNLISHVKARLFDKFGINLNLNPDDMVALAERMIDQAASNAIGNNADSGSRFSRADQTNTPEFKKWFGDSKVVDANGKPQVRYHGTRDNWTQWDAEKAGGLIHTTDDMDIADRYAQGAGGGRKRSDPVYQDNDGNIYELDGNDYVNRQDGSRLSIRDIQEMMDYGDINPIYPDASIKSIYVRAENPLDLNAASGLKVLAGIQASSRFGQGIVNQAKDGYFDWNSTKHEFKNKHWENDLVPKLKELGYDAIIFSDDGHQTLSVFDPDQIKSATDNTGAFDANNPDIRFSRQSSSDVINNLSESIKNLSAKSIKDKAGYKWTDWLGVGLSALGRRQLTEIYSKLLPQLNKYNDLAAKMDADKNDAGAEADNIVREWSNLRDEDQLAEVMHDSTLAKIDPSKPYVSGDSISKYKQLRDAYRSLSPEAQAIYVKSRDAYKKHYAKVHQSIKDRILRSELSNQKKADLLKQMDDNFFGSIRGVYFPLARFGKYIVVMRNQNGDVESVSRSETMGEAQSLRSELMQKYPNFNVDRVILDKEFNAARDGVGRGFMTSLFAEVDNLGLSTSEQAEFEDTLSQLYLSSMPDLSWAKHGIHRKGTAGFSQDARRAFAQNMFSGANYLAKLRYGDQLAQQLDDMQKYASEKSKQDDSYDQPTAQRVIDEMNKRHDNLMNPKGHPLSSALTSLGFIYYLGLSPAAAMVNLSQTALVAYPFMGAKWGFDNAANELLKASNDFRKGVEFHKVKWEGTKTDLYKAVSSDISKFLNDDEKKAYLEAVIRGIIDVTQAHDLVGIAQGEDSGVMWKTRPIMRAASVMFHSAERFNREVTFIASYRLARQHGADHDSAFDQAVDMTYKGHYDYSSGNRPRIMQGNVAKVLLLFKQFGQNMVYTLARQTYQSIKGETKEERREARRAISAILAMHATFAGALGLPMVGMLLSVASWMGGDDDEPWDAEVALRNYLAEAFNPTISNMLMKGAPRGIGVDISSRVGINNLLLPDTQEGLEGKKWWDSAASAALGPIGGIGANVTKGAQEISEGHNLRGVESMLPVFLKNFAKTYRYADEGVQDKTGISIMDEVDSMDLLVQGMGFSPSDVRTANEGKTAIYQFDRKLNERRSRLMTLWSRAKMMDDQQEMDEIWEEIQGFNDKNPSRRITRINLNQSYRNRQRRIDRAEDGIYLPRNHQDAREVGKFADTD